MKFSQKDKPRFLFVTVNSPFKTSGGGEQRTKLMFDALCKLGHVDLVCFTKEDSPVKQFGSNYQIRFFGNGWLENKTRIAFLKEKLRFWSPYAIFESNAACGSVVRELLDANEYDCLVVRYLELVFGCGLFPHKKLVVDVDDEPGQKYYSYSKDKGICFKHRLLYFYQYALYLMHKKTIIKGVHHAFFSNKDQLTLKGSSYLPNIPFHITPEPLAPLPVNNTILFVGKMEYEPNWRGVDRFIKHVWPQVKSSIPDARFQIVGEGTPVDLRDTWSQLAGVEVLGYVENLASAYEQCKIVVAPIYHGAGTNIKVLESMSMQRTCVASIYALRGFSDMVFDKENIMIARKHKDFAAAIIKVLTDVNLNDKIRSRAYIDIRKYFSSAVFDEKLKKVTDSLELYH